MDGEHSRYGIEVGNDGIGFQGKGTVARKDETFLEHQVGFLECLIHVTIVQQPMTANVVSKFLVKEGRVRLQSSLAVHNGRQRFVLDLDQFHGVLGHIASRGNHHGYRLSHVANLSYRGTVVLKGCRYTNREGFAHLAHFLPCQNGNHTGMVLCFAGVVGQNSGVGTRTS